jgi:hypothetical protein
MTPKTPLEVLAQAWMYLLFIPLVPTLVWVLYEVVRFLGVLKDRGGVDVLRHWPAFYLVPAFWRALVRRHPDQSVEAARKRALVALMVMAALVLVPTVLDRLMR